VLSVLLAGCSIYDPPQESAGDSGPGTDGANEGSQADSSAEGDAPSEVADDVATDAGVSEVSSDAGKDAPDLDVLDASDAPPDLDGDGTAAVGCAGYALTFGGSTSTSFNRPVQDDFTLEAWVKTKTSRAGTNWFDGLGLLYSDNLGNVNDFGSSILNDKFCFGVGNPNTTIVSKTKVTTDMWVHVAATRRKSTGEIQVIVNGVLETSTTVNQKGSLNAQSLLTMGANGLSDRYFVGLMDEVRLWNVVRTPAEITATMKTRLSGTEAGLVSYFRLDDMGSHMAADSSTMKNDAIVTGPAVWVVSDAPLVCP
jgi:Concanavalin A-like lectin/glucanases superfamily